jgi:hypothetical protein
MDKMPIDKISSVLQIQKKYLPSPESEGYAHSQQRFQLPIRPGRWLHFDAILESGGFRIEHMIKRWEGRKSGGSARREAESGE